MEPYEPYEPGASGSADESKDPELRPRRRVMIGAADDAPDLADSPPDD